VSEEYSYDPDPEDARTLSEKKQDAQQQAYRARRTMQAIGEGALAREVSGEMRAEIEGVQAWAQRRRQKKGGRQKGGRGVEVALEVEK
jgi:hypothetical protein